MAHHLFMFLWSVVSYTLGVATGALFWRKTTPAVQPPTPDQIANQEAAEHYARQHPTVHSVRFVRAGRPSRRPTPDDEERGK